MVFPGKAWVNMNVEEFDFINKGNFISIKKYVNTAYFALRRVKNHEIGFGNFQG